MTVRFLERHLLATITAYATTQLTSLGWVTGTINFGAPALTIINEHPDQDVDVQVAPQTLAITLGDSASEELYQLGGGLYCQPVPVFFDVYAQDASLAVALATDVRDLFKREIGIDYQEWYTGSGISLTGAWIIFQDTAGPQRPPRSEEAAAGDFRKHWRVVKTIAQVEFND